MRILLDESLPRKLASELTGHESQTVQKRNPAALPIAVIVLVAVNNRIETLRPLIPDVLEVLKTIRPGQLVRVGA